MARPRTTEICTRTIAIRARTIETIKSNFNPQIQIEGIVLTMHDKRNSLSALVEEDVTVYEKLKTLYLKRPWMYNEKIFNLNPLYLDDWSQLRDFGVDAILVYNNLIPYYAIDRSVDDIYEIAVSFRIIDINTGSIIQVGEISN